MTLITLLLVYLFAFLFISEAKFGSQVPSRNLIRNTRAENINSESFSSVCSSFWDVDSQSFNVSLSWTDVGQSLTFDITLLVYGRFFPHSTSNSFFNDTVAPREIEANATYVIQNLGESLTSQCCIELSVPPATEINTVEVLTANISLIDTQATVEELIIKWMPPIPPTGNIDDCIYQVRFGANSIIPDNTDIVMVNNLNTSMDQTFQSGNVNSIDMITVHTNTTQLYFQIRSLCNITVSNFTHTLASNWSPAQEIPLFLASFVTSSSMNTHVPPPTSTLSSTKSSSSRSQIQSSTTSPTAVTTVLSRSTSSLLTTVSSSLLTTVSSSSTIVAELSTSSSSQSLSQSATESTIVVPSQQSLNQVYIIVGVVTVSVLVIVVLIVVIILIIFVFSRRDRKKITPHANRQEMIELQVPPRDTSSVGSTSSDEDKWEVPHKCVDKQKLIGKGGFGDVYKGSIKGFTNSIIERYVQKNNHNHLVAIKTLKDSATEFDKKQFLKEISLMKTISNSSNPHVINMVGSSTVEEPFMLIIEFMQYGDLLSYLRACRKQETISDELAEISDSDIPSFGFQIASGMEFLASKKLVHRDLACRNILMGDNRKLKITDFGLSRKVNLESMYIAQPGGRFPVRWMAIESIIDREFTTSSDVWSFGVTLWEIGSLGETPYSTIGNTDILSHIKCGNRLDKPDRYITDNIYSLMMDCWKEVPSERPNFTQLRNFFDTIISSQQRQSQYYMDLSTQQMNSSNSTGSLARNNLYVKIT